MLVNKIKNSNDFTDEEKQELIKLVNKHSHSANNFPEKFINAIGIDLEYDPNDTHIVKRNILNHPSVEDYKYVLFTINEHATYLEDASDYANCWIVDNTEEMKRYIEEDPESDVEQV